MNNSKHYLDKIITIIDKPYFFEMENYGIRDKREQVYVLCKIYDNNIRINCKSIYDSKGNQIYSEFMGFWEKYEYDSNSNM